MIRLPPIKVLKRCCKQLNVKCPKFYKKIKDSIETRILSLIHLFQGNIAWPFTKSGKRSTGKQRVNHSNVEMQMQGSSIKKRYSEYRKLNFLKVTQSCSLIKSQIFKALLIKQTLLRKMGAPDALIHTKRLPL